MLGTKEKKNLTKAQNLNGRKANPSFAWHEELSTMRVPVFPQNDHGNSSHPMGLLRPRQVDADLEGNNKGGQQRVPAGHS